MGIAHTCEMCGRTYKTEDTFRHHLTDGACKAKSLVEIDSLMSLPRGPSYGLWNP